MAKQPQDDEQVTREHGEAMRLKAAIGKTVMFTLGQPTDLHCIQVRQLWPDHYRVNVFVGLDAASAKIAHSYFLLADNAGNVVESWPVITRQY